jgi:hypothetical protein
MRAGGEGWSLIGRRHLRTTKYRPLPLYTVLIALRCQFNKQFDILKYQNTSYMLLNASKGCNVGSNKLRSRTLND